MPLMLISLGPAGTVRSVSVRLIRRAAAAVEPGRGSQCLALAVRDGRLVRNVALPRFLRPELAAVYADPAGHPFCIGWGHPSREALADFVRASDSS